MECVKLEWILIRKKVIKEILGQMGNFENMEWAIRQNSILMNFWCDNNVVVMTRMFLFLGKAWCSVMLSETLVQK